MSIPPLRLITVAPGHFHAALVQKRMMPGVAPRCYVYAPLDADLVAHLDRLAAFNSRTNDPTHWEVDVRAGASFLERFLQEQPGNTVVLSGRNRPKIDLMLAAVANNLHVLADKPWIIDASDLPKLDQLLRDAERREVLVCDVMTERHEIATRLQQLLIRDPEVFGDWQTGSLARPALSITSVHGLKKAVAGRPLIRPWWWFDPNVSGDAMADVGTHLADLALRFVCPERSVEFTRDVVLLDADRWPLVLEREQFTALTGLADYPDTLKPRAVQNQLYYAGNTTAAFTLRGVHVQLETRWEFELPRGDDHLAIARGTRATITVRRGPEGDNEVVVQAADPAQQHSLAEMLRHKWADPSRGLAGVAVEDCGAEVRLMIPAAQRTRHEDHFAEVVEEFVGYFRNPRSLPSWERANVLTKYQITTRAVELARQRRGF